MAFGAISLSITSYVLGLAHGMDSDHIIDVTDFISQDPRPMKAVFFGSKFAIGHTVTVFAAGLAAFALKSSLPSAFDQFFQVLSGIVLMALGVWGIHRRLVRPLRSRTPVQNQTSLDRKIFKYGPVVVGVMTGLVGTAAIMVFGPVESAPDIYLAGLFILIYGAGVLSSMCIYAFAAAKLFTRLLGGSGTGKLAKAAAFVPAVFSIGLGMIWVSRFVAGAAGVVKFLVN